MRDLKNHYDDFTNTGNVNQCAGWCPNMHPAAHGPARAGGGAGRRGAAGGAAASCRGGGQ